MTSLPCGLVASGTPAEPGNVDAAPGTRHHILLNSNEPPLESEVPAIQLAISKTDAQLARLDDEIAGLHQRLKQLEEERISLSTYRARNQAILSVLRRIPPEVLGEIFSWSLPTSASSIGRPRFHRTDSPWSLTQISGRWRAVAVSNPFLWSFIAIQY
ncbi:hypothetical protein B0H19DRAFT_928456, partial [Mycena capillaripes]